MKVKGGDIDGNQINTILVIQLGDIGDVIVTIGCLRALRENFPDARLIAAVKEKAADVVSDCGIADGVIAINQDKRSTYQTFLYQWRFFKRFRQYHFDLAIDLRTGDRSAFLSILSGARQRIGFYGPYNSFWRNRLYTHLFQKRQDNSKHMSLFYYSLLDAYGIQTQNTLPHIEVSPEKLRLAENFLKEHQISLTRPIIVVQPFALWEYKEWGVDNFIHLINRIKDRFDVDIILNGSKNECRKSNRIVTGCKHKIFDLTGLTGISMITYILKLAVMRVGVDSAGLHIAAAVGTPTLTLFGPTHQTTWAYSGDDHIIVHKKLECIPCGKKGCNGSEISKCLTELSVDEVWHVLEDFLFKRLNCV